MKHVPLQDPSVEGRNEYGERAHPFRCTRCLKTALPGRELVQFTQARCESPTASKRTGRWLRRFTGLHNMRRGDVSLGPVRIPLVGRIATDLGLGLMAGLALIAAIGPML